jgi:hypothetical protein
VGNCRKDLDVKLPFMERTQVTMLILDSVHTMWNGNT